MYEVMQDSHHHHRVGLGLLELSLLGLKGGVRAAELLSKGRFRIRAIGSCRTKTTQLMVMKQLRG